MAQMSKLGGLYGPAYYYGGGTLPSTLKGLGL